MEKTTKAKFIMLIGLPGAGKSTMASKYAVTYSAKIVSSDEIRKELYGDEAIQDNPNKVFELVKRRAISFLQNGENVTCDATNIQRKHRAHLLSALPDCLKIAIVVWAKVEDCVKRDSSRERHVGQDVIERMLRSFQPPYYDEGWDIIKTEYTGDCYTLSDYVQWIDCLHDNPHHNNSVKEHTHNVVNHVTKVCEDNGLPEAMYLLHIVAFLHDTGKRRTKSFVNAHGETTQTAHFYDHHNVSSYYAIGYEPLLGLRERQKNLVVWLVNAHMEPFFNSKYYRGLTGKERKLLDLFHSCDVLGA